jgi:hypothetical protein
MIEDQLMYHSFRPGRLQGLWSTLRELDATVRVKGGRNPQLSAVIIDGQSTKTTVVRDPTGP